MHMDILSLNGVNSIHHTGYHQNNPSTYVCGNIIGESHRSWCMTQGNTSPTLFFHSTHLSTRIRLECYHLPTVPAVRIFMHETKD